MQRRSLALEVRPSPYSLQSRGGAKPRPIAVGASASLPTGLAHGRWCGPLEGFLRWRCPLSRRSRVCCFRRFEGPKPGRQQGETRVAARAPRMTQPPSGSMAEREEAVGLSLVNIAATVRDDSSVLQSLARTGWCFSSKAVREDAGKALKRLASLASFL